MKFNGIGDANQHVAHFKATCGNTGGNFISLLRQFVSLTRIAFEWYSSLPDDSVQTFAQMELMFKKRFASFGENITLTDHAKTEMKEGENANVTNWRNLSIKYDQDIDQEQAVSLVTANIKSWTALILMLTQHHYVLGSFLPDKQM